MRYGPIASKLGLILALSFLATASAETQKTEKSAGGRAKQILEATGTQGGFIVHLGCGDGRLTAALRADQRFTVHGLDADAAHVAAARQHIRSLNLYGPVSVEQFDGSRLPYTDNLIDLVVVSDPEQVPTREILRVLVPNGKAYFVANGKVMTKPRPDSIDEWSHFLHDPTNNAVADDRQVGPPRSLQWVAPPLWLRSHETPSGIQAAVFSGGRTFYFLDEGLIGITDERLPDRWSLVCRDAFNGKLLWKRPLGDWGWRAWARQRWEGKDWTQLRAARTNVPDEAHRRLVAVGDRVFVTLAFRAPMSILDAATGKTLMTVEKTKDAREILVADGVAVVYVQKGGAEAAQRRGQQPTGQTALIAVEAASGRVLWKTACGVIKPLLWAIDHGRVVYISGKQMAAVSLKDGQPLWKVPLKRRSVRTMVATDNVVATEGGNFLAVYDATSGQLLWEKKVPPIAGAEAADLFVINGLVFRGMTSVDDEGRPSRKTAHVLAVGRDLRTGEEKKRLLVRNLRSPEHHHRCYRNRATTRFVITSMEGAEFVDLLGGQHSQENWIRGACRYGMTPCYGMLYVPADQCFCEPGAKLLGFTALRAAPASAPPPVPDDQRLKRGPAYDSPSSGRAEQAAESEEPSGGRHSGHSQPSALNPQPSTDSTDWPTYRHDPARHGTVPASVPVKLETRWRVKLGRSLTQPTVVGGTVYVAEKESHTLYALDRATGQIRWLFTAGGRIDSPPTIYHGLVLFGSHDGRVYCLRASDGQLVWKFLAAPYDQRVGDFDQLASTWPVHGSVLVVNDVAYFAAGRSTYLDGGIYFYGLNPQTGRILHEGRLQGPFPKPPKTRDVSFFILGANSDVLVSEGGFLYMRQKKLTLDLKEVPVPVLSSKGAQDVGLHVFSTASLLDGSWYNRTFWMYSKRWPGFQLANQAPKTGQILVVDDRRTYALRVFYRRNVHSPMFFPETKGYLVFADWNTTEPQIVGEPGSKPPVRWLPQSDYSRANRKGEIRKLDSEAFGLDKMIGYTRAEPPVWMTWLKIRVRGMVKAGDRLYVAGPPDVLDPQDPYGAFEGRKGARLAVLDAEDGRVLNEQPLDTPPVFDGLIAARGCLFVSLRDGSLLCLGGAED
ncbi:MAG: PQQ-binding-like beta-propeller repeat protein [Planctomycetes bacterium]|nr:PQQ-binding-like beta-propeller repeat protein [Planctomycetota bacterium]